MILEREKKKRQEKPSLLSMAVPEVSKARLVKYFHSIEGFTNLAWVLLRVSSQSTDSGTHRQHSPDALKEHVAWGYSVSECPQDALYLLR